MSSDGESEDGTKKQSPTRKAKAKGGDPHAPQEQNLKLSVLSGSATASKWSFGSAPRFTWARDEPKLGQSRSSPCMSLASVSTTDELVPQTQSTDMTLRPNGMIADGASSKHNSTMPAKNSRWMQSTSSMDNTFALCNSSKAPRLEGSLDRASSPRPKMCEPQAKSYNPAETFGELTAPTFTHAPHFSFGGGRSRCHDQEKAKRFAELTAGLEVKKLSDRASPSTGMVVKSRTKMCRGFGTEVRLRHRGGFQDLPITPGPAAYALPRECDATPQWGSQSLLPFGKRTGERSELALKLSTDAGPGGYIEDHPFQAAAPSALFGLRLNVPVASNANFPDPCAYDIPTKMGVAPAYSMGQRGAPLERTPDGPGPVYDPRMESVYPHTAGAVFGTVERRHECDEVDPDEPPGPGSYQLSRQYRASDKPSTGWPKAERKGARAMMGPMGVPGPGEYQLPQHSRGAAVSMGGALPGKVEPSIGPGHYGIPSDHLCRQSAPGYRPLHQTAIRQGPFGAAKGFGEKASEAVLAECAMEVAKTAQAMGFGTKKCDDTLTFKPVGPKYSMAPRRTDKIRRDDVAFTRAVSSMG